MKKKIISAILVIALAVSAVMLSGCTAAQGTDGKSAYDIAVEYGFKGTIAEWLESLKGQNGSDSTSGNSEITINTDGISGIQYAASKGLLSSVTVYSHFVKTVSSGSIFGFGRGQQTQDYDYYSAGSGVIYQLDKASGSAFIITNYHVVYDSSSNTSNKISNDINIFIYGKEMDEYAIPAKYIGGSMTYDIAVLYVENSELLKKCELAPISIADSDDISAGQYAIAIGNPEARGISVTYGVVSVPSEYISMTAVDNVTQISWRVVRIDTAVNSGNSGGGLFNDKGELIGIVNSKVSSSSVENIGYAIPSNVAIAIADNIIYYCFGTEKEAVQRALLGVTVQTVDSEAKIDKKTGLIRIYEKVQISEISDNAIANGKLETGDIIKSVTLGNTTKIVDRKYQIIDLLLKARAGDVVKIEVERNGKTQTVEITITEGCLAEY